MSWGKAALWGFGVAAVVILLIGVAILFGTVLPAEIAVPAVIFFLVGTAITVGVYVGNNLDI